MIGVEPLLPPHQKELVEVVHYLFRMSAQCLLEEAFRLLAPGTDST